MASIAVLLISILVPSIFAQCTVERSEPFFRRSVYEFSVDLLIRIAQEKENHFVTSTFSPWALISAVSLGATDETLAEIKKVLRLHPHKCFNSKFFEIIKKITAASDGTTLERSSTLFADDRMSLNEVFKNRIKKTEVTNIEVLPFENSADVAATINDYVSAATHGNIQDIVSPSDLDGVYLVLIDALYFKGTWRNQFSSADTEASAFYDERGNQIGDVNLMFSQQNVNYTTISQIASSVLELPYGSNNRFSMLFFLPDAGTSISSVLQKLKIITLGSIFTLFNQERPKTVSIQIPRFKINSDLDNLKELLVDMGLKTMFDMNQAKFADISDYSLYISNFIQKATIEVNEEGAEASAASAAFFEARSLQFNPEFTANRPFLYMIVDRQTEVALFAGAYSKPSTY